jgi:NAD(P)-dependent dehydrogenase (short-subunit alcohol dehydrogenase family)
MADLKTAIVTASSRGIGAACARELARAGYKLVLMSRSDEIHTVGRELDAIAIQGSVTKEEDIERVVNAAMAAFGRIDVVINNSGHPPSGEINSITDEHWLGVFEMYFLSVVRMARHVTPVMIAQRSGAIINISGADATEPDPRFGVASTIRASMSAFRKLYAREYARHGIRMNCLMPSVVLDSDSSESAEAVKREAPMGRAATYEEVAKAALFLVSDGAAYITGHGLRVDGGLTRSL